MGVAPAIPKLGGKDGRSSKTITEKQNMSPEVKYRPTSGLRAHPFSLAIYGEPNVDDLLESMPVDGILEPLAVKPDGTVISGHRRLMAALRLGLETVPTIEVSYDDELDERRAIIAFNRQRRKTFSQQMREAEALEKLMRETARRRQATSGPGAWEAAIAW